MSFGVCSITRAELRADVTGLNIASKSRYRRVQVQLDSRCALQLIRQATGEIHSTLLLCIRFRS
ncbi:hypothetical protein LINGRAHAP2_LOCUS33365 [Linum grandiflorum]